MRVGAAEPRAAAQHVTAVASTTPSRAARASDTVARAAAGEVISIRTHAARYAITPATAATDLHALTAAGALRAIGARRGLRFVHATAPEGEGAEQAGRLEFGPAEVEPVEVQPMEDEPAVGEP